MLLPYLRCPTSRKLGIQLSVHIAAMNQRLLVIARVFPLYSMTYELTIWSPLKVLMPLPFLFRLSKDT
jgi:hypothetical protein